MDTTSINDDLLIKKPDYFLAQIAFQQLLIKPGQPAPKINFTVKLIKAKDEKDALQKLEADWKKKHPGFAMVKVEIQKAIE